jgi:hypothetical protein
VRKYEAAELDDRESSVEPMSDAELMRIAMGRQPEDVRPVSNLITLTADK